MHSSNSHINGVFWNSLDRFASHGIQLIVSIILARFLLPEDFGLVAMLSVFISMSDLLMQGGFRQAIVTQHAASDVDYSTAFVYNIVMSVCMYICFYIAAPYIAKFYQEPRLIAISRSLSLVLVLNAGYLVQDAVLNKNMMFKALAVRSLLSYGISGAFAVFMAYKGLGVWSLVALTLTRAIIINIFMWMKSIWKFSVRFSWVSFRTNFGFISRIVLTNFTGIIFNNVNNLLIGKYYSQADLGLYYQAKKLETLPIDTASQVVLKTATPLLASKKNNINMLRFEYERFLRLISVLLVPLPIILFLVGSDLIQLLYGDKWAASIPIFKILLIQGLFWPFIVLNGYSPIIIGNSKAYLRIDTIYKILLIVTIAISIKWGLLFFIAAQSAFSLIQMLGNTIIAHYFYKVHVRKQYSIMLPYYLYGLAAGVISNMIGMLLNEALALLRTTVLFFAYVATYLLFIYIFDRRTFEMLINKVASMIYFKKVVHEENEH